MAQLFNNQPVIGIKLVSEGETLFNNQSVIGVRTATAQRFENNQIVRGVQSIDDGSKLFNGWPVIGAVVILDGRTIYNGRPVMPVTGDIYWSFDNLFAGGQAGFYSGPMTPPPFDLSQLFGTDTAGFYSGKIEVI